MIIAVGLNYEVDLGPVTERILQSYRSGSHIKLNLEVRAQCYNQSGNTIKLLKF